MSNRRRPLVALPAPDTEYVATSFSEVSEDFTVVAFRTAGERRDRWSFAWCNADMARWREALAAGDVVSAQQLRNGSWVLLAKLAGVR